MLNITAKQRKEEEIHALFTEIQKIQDRNSLEYKKLFQKIYTPIWDWALICFKEEDVRLAGVEIFHCIKRTLHNYKENSTSYVGYLYSCLENEIRHVKERGELKKFRMCTRDEYNRAVQLINTAKRIGKNPSNENVQQWIAKQSGLTIDEVKDLIVKYHQSQIVDEQIKNAAEVEGETSIFETDAVENNYLTPEEELYKTEYALEDIKKIEVAFEGCQIRQKEWLNTFITLRVLQVLEMNFLKKQIMELLENRNFIDLILLQDFINHNKLPEQAELAARIGKDEGSVSNTIKTFFGKIQKNNPEISTV